MNNKNRLDEQKVDDIVKQFIKHLYVWSVWMIPTWNKINTIDPFNLIILMRGHAEYTSGEYIKQFLTVKSW